VGDRPRDYQGVVLVPGGSVEAEIRGSTAWAVFEGIGGPGRVWQDVVVRDSNGLEVYREGPWDGILIGKAVQRVSTDISRSGFEAFVRRQQVEYGQFGPVHAPSTEMRFPVLGFLRIWVDSLMLRLRMRIGSDRP